MKLVALILGILFGAGVLMLAKGQIDGSAGAVAEGAVEGAEAPVTVVGIIAQRRANMRPWSGAAAESAVFDTSRLTDKRAVHVAVTVPFEDLLAEGEDAPEEVYRDTYAAARAPAHLAALCAEVLETIALQCDVANPRAKVLRDGEVSIKGKLRFVPRDAAGTPSASGEARVMLMPLSFQSGTMTHNSARGRIGFMEMAQEACARLREIVGNCVINDLHFKPVRNARHNGKVLMEVQGRLAIYAGQAEVDGKAIDAAFEGLTGGLRLLRRKGS